MLGKSLRMLSYHYPGCRNADGSVHRKPGDRMGVDRAVDPPRHRFLDCVGRYHRLGLVLFDIGRELPIPDPV